jgi:hypothetical protein
VIANHIPLLTDRDAILEVARHADRVDATASSHWRLDDGNRAEHPLKRDPFDFVYGPEGFRSLGPIGAISVKTGRTHRLIHRLLQTPIRAIGRRFRHFPVIDRAAAGIARRQGRIYDKDLLRHALTLALLREHLDLAQERDPIAVIGDGFGNMAALILAHLPESRVVLVNLTKTLLVDLAFLHRAMPEAGIALVRDAGEMQVALKRPELRVIALGADLAGLLAGVPVALGINILSMMEMDPPVTQAYFDVLRRCPRARTAFYCCNRVEKRLPDGTVTRFEEYPWRADDEILLDAASPWDRVGYNGRPPFYYRNKPIRHRLAWLKKTPKHMQSGAGA